MRRYTEPEMICKRFAAECVITTSGGGASSMSLLKQQLESKRNLQGDAVIERNWATMGE